MQGKNPLLANNIKTSQKGKYSKRVKHGLPRVTIVLNALPSLDPPQWVRTISNNSNVLLVNLSTITMLPVAIILLLSSNV